MIKIKKLSSTAILPSYAHEQDAGMDFYADETVTLLPGERHAVRTGIAMAIPPGYAGLIWDKSGIALQHGLKTMAGVIDAGYRGEVRIVLHNIGRDQQGEKGFGSTGRWVFHNKSIKVTTEKLKYVLTQKSL